MIIFLACTDLFFSLQFLSSRVGRNCNSFPAYSVEEEEKNLNAGVKVSRPIEVCCLRRD